jgi:hypothetical protein
MYSTTTNITANIEELQSDILLDNLDDNSLFKESSIASLNKKLITAKQNIVQAINEISNDMKSLNNTVTKSLQQQYDIIGDTLGSPELVEKVTAIDANLILALTKTNNQVKSINQSLAKTKKDIVFVIPKITTEVTQPEIYFPYRGYLKQLTANLGTRNIGKNTNDLNFKLERYSESKQSWIVIEENTIAANEIYVLKNITTETSASYIDFDTLRIHVDNNDMNLTDLTVIATVEVAI